MTRTFCDRCGADIQEGQEITLDLQGKNDGENFWRWDLCERCAAEFKAWMDEPKATPAQTLADA